jgi:hypothetical protein
MVGGNLILYPSDCGTPTIDLLTVKLLLNSVMSNPGIKFMTIDIKDFYLITPIDQFEYMKLKLSDLPEDFVDQYQLELKGDKSGQVYVEARKEMYGLPQAGLLAQQLLEERLNKKGYSQSTLVPRLWTHKWRPITFTLCVDNFGVKYTGKEHADHLMAILEENYTISHNWSGSRYLRMYIDWDYASNEVYLSMLSYVQDALKRFHHVRPRRKQDRPHPHIKPMCGAKAQCTTDEDESP